MQVDDNLQTVVPGPCNSFLEEGKLSRDIWFPGTYVESPIAYRNADMV